MKIVYVLPILLGLTACYDKPIYVQNGLWCVNRENGATEKPTINISLYKNYAILSIDNQTTKLQQSKKYIREDGKFKSIQYETNGDKLVFTVNVFKENTGIGLVLNGMPCLFPETTNLAGSENSWPYNRHQMKTIDDNTQKELEKLFK